MKLGVVIIGRNEGERLKKCIESSIYPNAPYIYVDSGSVDGSVKLASALGADVLSMDEATPFTAARARNAGYQRLLELEPAVEYVQFVDGDCELFPKWLSTSVAFLDAHPEIGAVCGRLHERYPERSVYNLLCDLEWDSALGEIQTSGGNVLMRVAAFRQSDGFRTDLIAGEEPELCMRLRANGWRIWRLDTDMAWHDAAMTRFGQWWTRAVRAGHAYAQGAYLHGAGRERYAVRESRRALLWGLGLPLATAALVGLWGVLGLVIVAIYPLQIARLALHAKPGARARWTRAAFLVLGKFPEAQGNLKFLFHRVFDTAPRIIEYK